MVLITRAQCLLFLITVCIGMKNNVNIDKDDMFRIVFGLKYNKKHEYP